MENLKIVNNREVAETIGEEIVYRSQEFKTDDSFIVSVKDGDFIVSTNDTIVEKDKNVQHYTFGMCKLEVIEEEYDEDGDYSKDFKERVESGEIELFREEGCFFKRKERLENKVYITLFTDKKNKENDKYEIEIF